MIQPPGQLVAVLGCASLAHCEKSMIVRSGCGGAKPGGTSGSGGLHGSLSLQPGGGAGVLGGGPQGSSALPQTAVGVGVASHGPVSPQLGVGVLAGGGSHGRRPLPHDGVGDGSVGPGPISVGTAVGSEVGSAVFVGSTDPTVLSGGGSLVAIGTGTGTPTGLTASPAAPCAWLSGLVWGSFVEALAAAFWGPLSRLGCAERGIPAVTSNAIIVKKTSMANLRLPVFPWGFVFMLFCHAPLFVAHCAISLLVRCPSGGCCISRDLLRHLRAGAQMDPLLLPAPHCGGVPLRIHSPFLFEMFSFPCLFDVFLAFRVLRNCCVMSTIFSCILAGELPPAG